MSFEDPTQRLRTAPRDPAQTTAALPRPLDLAGRTPDSSDSPDDTNELSLDEIFEDSSPQEAAAQPADAPTWTAMPVIPVRSEPIPAAPTTARTGPDIAQTGTKRTGPSTAERLLTDAEVAWNGALRRSQDWLTTGDNGLMLMTAVVAIILILVVAAVG